MYEDSPVDTIEETKIKLQNIDNFFLFIYCLLDTEGKIVAIYLNKYF